MIVIADTSPLSALAEIGELDLLRELYGRVFIPESVARECRHAHAPPQLADEFARPDTAFLIVPDPNPLLPETLAVDPGEAAAITLAWEQRDDAMLIIDDLDGRRLCEALNLRKTGTAGVLLAAAEFGLVDFEEVLTRLQATSFRLGDTVVTELRRRLNP